MSVKFRPDVGGLLEKFKEHVRIRSFVLAESKAGLEALQAVTVERLGHARPLHTIDTFLGVVARLNICVVVSGERIVGCLGFG